LPAVVVCVGNITTGGTGKTPAVIHLARRLAGSGIKTTVISRGYGFHVTGDYLIVSGPDGPLREAGQAPDEALMTARKLPGVPVIVSPNRYRAGKAALDCFGAEVLLMDDGFQHLGLFRDIDVLVVDGPILESTGAAGRPGSRCRARNEPTRLAIRTGAEIARYANGLWGKPIIRRGWRRVGW
jgi:tetraacyldisaccharide 4'-kinase